MTRQTFGNGVAIVAGVACLYLGYSHHPLTSSVWVFLGALYLRSVA